MNETLAAVNRAYDKMDKGRVLIQGLSFEERLIKTAELVALGFCRDCLITKATTSSERCDDCQIQRDEHYKDKCNYEASLED